MNRPSAVNVDEASPFEAQAFFEAIPSDPERGMALLRTQVPSDGPPTPRAAVFLENGEWDDSTTITVTFVSSDTCVGRVGVVVSGDGVRFCGLPRIDCGAKLHATSYNPMDEFSVRMVHT